MPATMRTLRLAAGLFALYALAVIANALFYTHWSGDAAGLPHALGRCAGIGLLESAGQLAEAQSLREREAACRRAVQRRN